MSDRVSDNVLSALRVEIRRIMNERADHIAGGGCADFAEYSKHCGVIEGLALAERELLDLNNRLERE